MRRTRSVQNQSNNRSAAKRRRVHSAYAIEGARRGAAWKSQRRTGRAQPGAAPDQHSWRDLPFDFNPGSPARHQPDWQGSNPPPNGTRRRTAGHPSASGYDKRRRNLLRRDVSRPRRADSHAAPAVTAASTGRACTAVGSGGSCARLNGGDLPHTAEAGSSLPVCNDQARTDRLADAIVKQRRRRSRLDCRDNSGIAADLRVLRRPSPSPDWRLGRTFRR